MEKKTQLTCSDEKEIRIAELYRLDGRFLAQFWERLPEKKIVLEIKFPKEIKCEGAQGIFLELWKLFREGESKERLLETFRKSYRCPYCGKLTRHEEITPWKLRGIIKNYRRGKFTSLLRKIISILEGYQYSPLKKLEARCQAKGLLRSHKKICPPL